MKENSEKEEQKEKAESIRLESFRFSMCNLKEGDVIEFKYDRNITCVVKNDKKVIYEGEEYSLSALAQKLTGKNYPHPGPEYWYYNGERLYNHALNLKAQPASTIKPLLSRIFSALFKNKSLSTQLTTPAAVIISYGIMGILVSSAFDT